VRVQAAPNGREDARLGLSVPGLPGAVQRNRARRRLREAARGLDAHHGFDLVVSTDASVLTLPFALLRGQVETAAAAAVGLARAASGPVPPAVDPRARNRQGEARPGRPAGGRAGQP
jgi:RNase P protein component